MSDGNEVQAFIADSLIQIERGINQANGDDGGMNKYSLHRGYAKDEQAVVRFDIAITAEQSRGGDGKAGISIKVARVELGGEASKTESHTSHVRFPVFVDAKNRR